MNLFGDDLNKKTRWHEVLRFDIRNLVNTHISAKAISDYIRSIYILSMFNKLYTKDL